MLCEKCGMQNRDGEKVCVKCGAKLPEQTGGNSFRDILTYPVGQQSRQNPQGGGGGVGPGPDPRMNEQIERLHGLINEMEMNRRRDKSKAGKAMLVAIVALLLAALAAGMSLIKANKSDIDPQISEINRQIADQGRQISEINEKLEGSEEQEIETETAEEEQDFFKDGKNKTVFGLGRRDYIDL